MMMMKRYLDAEAVTVVKVTAAEFEHLSFLTGDESDAADPL
jgi:hypothetical protein